MADAAKDQKDQQKDVQPAQQQPATAGAAPVQPRPQGSGQSGVFGDGSTQEQQDRLVREAEEANASIKQYADADREARGQ